jgi:CRISPR-associated protein Csm1
VTEVGNQRIRKILEDAEEFSLGKVNQENLTHKEKCITSIFNEISFNGISIKKEEKSQEYCYLVAPLSPETALPVEKGKVKNTQERYKEVVNAFVNDLLAVKDKVKKLRENLKVDAKHLFDIAFEGVRSAFIKNFWAVPSYTQGAADVSLADHSLTTAAIATALYRAKQEKLLLLSVDFSGIQKFIFQEYKETKKWAAKILRARSFLISLALEGVINRIIDECKVNRSAVIMNAGGKAYLLLPPNEEAINEVKREVKNALLKNFRGELKVKFS